MVTPIPPATASPEDVRILPMGEHALLLEVGGLDEVLALHARLDAARIPGILDLVPAARTVLVHVDTSRLPLSAARAWVRTGAGSDDAAAATPVTPTTVELDVVYDGPDLAETAEALGLTVDELVRRHTAAQWSVAFTGFAPGFGYLVSPDWTFDVPRLTAPRTRVPRGAVGLAARFSGAYPRESPGGWRLIGTTDAPLFDPDAADAASAVLLPPGTRVRFRARPHRDATQTHSRVDAPARGGIGQAREPAVRVVDAGMLATVQDLGRPGLASLGVARSGAMDRAALRTANRLLGNREGAAAIEVTMGVFRAIAVGDVWFAVTGAWGRIGLGGREVDPYEAHLWHSGEALELDWFAHGLRAYLALRGGVAAPPVLGSRATDSLAGLGPASLGPGTAIAIGDHAVAPVPAATLAPWSGPHDDELEVELAPGPRADWFAASALPTIFESVWTVTNDADRVGMRLDGPALERRAATELPSEGMVPGALQVPPSGRPTILLADGPVTGGYPVIAVVADASLDALAQARPGTRLRFRHARRR
ncbi:MAG: 5-oxoprolinase/urea amidolyase family protein [Microbacterium pygmaeum]